MPFLEVASSWMTSCEMTWHAMAFREVVNHFDLLSFIHSWRRPTWPKCSAIDCYWLIDSATYLYARQDLCICQLPQQAIKLTTVNADWMCIGSVVLGAYQYALGSFTSRPHAAVENRANFHVSWMKMVISVVELFVISRFVFKFLMDMHRKRVSTEQSLRCLRFERAWIIRHRYFLRRRMLRYKWDSCI